MVPTADESVHGGPWYGGEWLPPVDGHILWGSVVCRFVGGQEHRVDPALRLKVASRPTQLTSLQQSNFVKAITQHTLWIMSIRSLEFGLMCQMCFATVSNDHIPVNLCRRLGFHGGAVGPRI